mmetsp:Transcript_40287/g.35800  ORF Transcript_40287/g.35800 Transcript_40287/m.35800 type:complete len:191 (-) Transcript_40287:578-1150(-)
MIQFILNIYKAISSRPRDVKSVDLEEKFLYPIPKAKYQIIDPNTIRTLVNVLLLQDDDLILELLDFFNTHLCDKFTFKSLTYGVPLYEFLLYNINNKTIQPRFNLLLKIYHRITDELNAEEDTVKAFTSFSFETLANQQIETAFRTYPLLRYIPKHFVWRLINIGTEDFIKIFVSDNYETPELIWNEYMR